PSDITRWWNLGELRFGDKNESEGVAAYESALWLAKDGDAQGLRDQLSERLGPVSAGASPTDVADLYRAVFSYSRAVTQAADPDVFRERTTTIHEHLRGMEPQLRKKGRWLLWREVLVLTGDKVE